MTARRNAPGNRRSADAAAAGEEEDLWDVKQAARFFKLSVNWVYRAAERGDIPYRRVASRLRFIPAELRAFVKGS